MLEIPESCTIAAQLNQIIRGKVVSRVLADVSPHRLAWFFGDPDAYHVRLAGKTIGQSHAIAGQVEIHAEDMRILFSDGINIRYFAPREKYPDKHQLLILWEDGSALTASVQMYGGICVFTEEEYENPYYLVAKEKPNPLCDAFDEAYFDWLLNGSKPGLSAKAFLATEQRIPGLGNGSLQDILFNARIHPRRKLGTLTERETQRLFKSVKNTLRAMVDGGGRDTEKDLFGQSGGYITQMSSKTIGKPCPSCGHLIIREAYLGGNVYFCPVCQEDVR